MSQLILNSELLTKLPNVKDEAVIVDEHGKTLGIYKPIDFDSLFANVSEEELDRIQQADDWVTTKELLEHLERR